MFEEIRNHNQAVAAQIIKGFGVDVDIEKANVGDVKVINGKNYVWTEYAPGKYDWHIKENKTNKTDEYSSRLTYENAKKQMDEENFDWLNIPDSTGYYAADHNEPQNESIIRDILEHKEDVKNACKKYGRENVVQYLLDNNETLGVSLAKKIVSKCINFNEVKEKQRKENKDKKFEDNKKLAKKISEPYHKKAKEIGNKASEIDKKIDEFTEKFVDEFKKVLNKNEFEHAEHYARELMKNGVQTAIVRQAGKSDIDLDVIYKNLRNKTFVTIYYSVSDIKKLYKLAQDFIKNHEEDYIKPLSKMCFEVDELRKEFEAVSRKNNDLLTKKIPNDKYARDYGRIPSHDFLLGSFYYRYGPYINN